MHIWPDRAAARLWNEQGMRWLIVTVRILLSSDYVLIILSCFHFVMGCSFFLFLFFGWWGMCGLRAMCFMCSFY